MKKIITLLCVLIFGAVAFFSVAFASHPCFIGKLCKDHILPPPPRALKMNLINLITPQYFNAGEINPPNDQQYISVNIPVFLSNFPRNARLIGLEIVQIFSDSNPNPTDKMTHVLYNGRFRPQLTVDNVLLPEKGGVVKLSAKVTYTPIRSIIDILMIGRPPREPLTVSASASSIGDTGNVYVSPIEGDDVILRCEGGGFSWPPQSDQGKMYIATVSISAADDYLGAASGIHPKVEFTGSSFPNTAHIMNDVYTKDEEKLLTVVLSEQDLDNTFTVQFKDNVGHESITWAFKIPPEKVFAAKQECVGYVYPMLKSDDFSVTPVEY